MRHLLLPFLLPFVLLLFASQAAAFIEDDLLKPEEAFRLEARAIDSQTIEASWDIERGYYLYRERFKFTTDSDSVVLGTADFPPGKIKEDEFFGKMETYRKRVAVKIPINQGSGRFTLTTVSQGCADIGVCYPPQTEKVEIKLPLLAAADDSTIGDALSGLKAALGFGSVVPEFLPVDDAYRFSAEALNADTLLARWEIADGYYLYRDKFSFKLLDGAGIVLGEPQLPRGKIKEDEFFGRMEVLYHNVDARLPITRSSQSAQNITIQVGYQGCADAGLCYPPQTRDIQLALPALVSSKGDPAGSAAAPLTSTTKLEPISEQDRLAQFLLDKPLILSVGLFFLLGIGLTFTPCVFPMIPILSGIIAGQGSTITTRKAFNLSLVYVLAMALTYTVAGVVVALAGANLQAMFQNPWVLSSFAALFVLLALSMFGFYELQLPTSLQTKLTQFSNRQAGGTYIGVAIMGLLSALIVGPCITAPLVAALLVIGQTGDPLLGGGALFALSMGMGVPLILVGTSAGKWLPKAGAWMDTTKAVFGVLLLALAIWFLERILPAAITLALWAILLIVTAIFMGAHSRLSTDASGWQKLWKGLGVVMLIYGALLLVGSITGARDPLQPLQGVLARSGNSGQPTHGLSFKRIKSVADLDREVAAASRAGRGVMLDFYADWCISCKEMERYTFSDSAVQAALGDSLLLQADVTANDAIDQALLQRFNLIGPPSILFFDSQGRERSRLRVMGFLAAEPFAAHVHQALN